MRLKQQLASKAGVFSTILQWVFSMPEFLGIASLEGPQAVKPTSKESSPWILHERSFSPATDFAACCVADTPPLLRFVVNPFP